jgi:hypothetical protein
VRGWIAIALLGLACAPPPSVLAQHVPQPGDTRLFETSEMAEPERPYWSEGEPRLFVATNSQLGVPYIRPVLTLGYGQPHWLWTGLGVTAIVMPSFVQGAFGVYANSPLLNLSFRLRDTQSFQKPFLEPRRSFTRAEVLDAPGPNARYWAWEAEAVGTLPLPHSALVADFIMVHSMDVPAGRDVYDESYRAIVRSPLFLVLRVAALARLLNADSLKVGVLVDNIFSTGRSEAVLRVGPVGQLQVTDHLALLGTLTLNVAGPDNLGLVLGAYGLAGLEYRWATGESNPKLPWQGELIP